MSKEMNDKLLCPFCGEELDTENYYVRCRNPYCNETAEMDGTEEIWQALIQSQRDLQIAKQALEDINDNYKKRLKASEDGFLVNWDAVARFYDGVVIQALAQITHDNNKE